ncbi:MAG: N-acetylmuramoyl-L-alanine amidase [Duncaniella sp.]|nr:N-acetylmuramoyl-L-alanine amidase [Duncaniella sp.]
MLRLPLRFIITFALSLLTAITVTAAGDFVVVIDPGHGGKDAGALGQRTNEKSINLLVAQKLAKILREEMNDVKVHMTREGDRFVALQQRADFANSKHADIFISIHANSVGAKSPNRTKVNGAAVYTLGLDRSDANLSVAMRENEVMKLEDDYTSAYEGFDPSSTESYIVFEMMQHKNMDQSISLAESVQNQLVRYAGRKNNGVRQAPFWVLVRTSMPAILVELDFICNPTMEKYMASESGSTRLARAIYNGVERYREQGQGTKVTKKRPSRPATEETYAEKPENTRITPAKTATASGIVYKIQFLTNPHKIARGDSRFKGLSPVDSYRDGGLYKFTYGSYSSMEEATRELAKVKKKFKDAFVIKTRDGKRIK